MEEHSNHPYDPDFYETGSTCPPKNHGGAVALLLAAAILLGSVATAVGAWNLTAERKKPASEDKSETRPCLRCGDGGADGYLRPVLRRSIPLRYHPEAGQLPRVGGKRAPGGRAVPAGDL